MVVVERLHGGRQEDGNQDHDSGTSNHGGRTAMNVPPETPAKCRKKTTP